MNDNPSVPSPASQMTPAEIADHERSVHDYPNIHFSPSEYVVIDVQRSKVGLIRIWLFALLVLAAMILVTVMIHQTSPFQLGFGINLALLIVTIALPLLVGVIGSYVYKQNTFIVTNERIFAHIQLTPFAQRSQNVEIEHIEDCSISQSGPLQMLLNYGTIRLSTIGDEQTYLFTYVANPKEQFRVVNHVVQQVDEGQATKYVKRKRR